MTTCQRPSPRGGNCKISPISNSLFCKNHFCPSCNTGKSSGDVICKTCAKKPPRSRAASINNGFGEQDGGEKVVEATLTGTSQDNETFDGFEGFEGFEGAPTAALSLLPGPPESETDATVVDIFLTGDDSIDAYELDCRANRLAAAEKLYACHNTYLPSWALRRTREEWRADAWCQTPWCNTWPPSWSPEWLNWFVFCNWKLFCCGKHL